MLAFIAPAQAQDDILLKTLDDELSREMEALKKKETPPYYIDYRVNEIQVFMISSSFGSLTQSIQDKARILTTNVKIGDYAIDDSHEIEHNSRGFREDIGGPEFLLPVDNEPLAVQQFLWRSTENAYKRS